MAIFNSYLGLVSATIGIVAVIEIIKFVIQASILFKFFNKSGQEEWKAIVPIVNKVTLLEVANMSPIWAIISVFILLSNFINLGIIGYIFAIAEIVVFGVIINIKIAKQYNLSVLFAIGMIFFPYIFYAIIAWGPFTYTGTKKQKNRINNAFSLKGNANDDYIPKSDFFRD